MKKLLLPIIIISWLTSCTKEYTCVCSKGFLSSSYEEVTVQATSEDNARNRCIDKGEALVGKSCNLK